MRVTRGLALAGLVVITLAGCHPAGSEPSAPSPNDQSPSAAPRTTPQLSPNASTIQPDELAILGLAREQAAAAIQPYGGIVVEEDKSLGIIRARFPVTNIEELKDIQQKLREAGISASIIAVLPTP